MGALRTFVIALAGVAVVATAAALAPAQEAAPTDIEWRTDLKAARQEAKKTGRPLLVVFR